MSFFRRKYKGFTLIELMIVVAIVGILAAIAVPAYQDYTKRAKVSEALGMADAAKSAVAESYQSNSDTFPTTNAAAGLLAASDVTSTYVTSLSVGAGGAITVTLKSISSGIDGKTVVFTPAAPAQEGGPVTWTCNTGTLDGRYLPQNCR